MSTKGHAKRGLFGDGAVLRLGRIGNGFQNGRKGASQERRDRAVP